ncbi:MAG: B12-binding domain-containing radical SAM protein [Desulfosarcina sp.]|nr:B12-binding domain-containing radical SAM protein [Desulfobacterales bacterium]
MTLFVFLTRTNSITAEYFAKVIREEGLHRFEIVPDVETLTQLRPDFVLFTAYDQLEEYFLAREWIADIKKSLPSAKIILGGSAFRSRPVAFFRNLKADYVLRGEADFTFQALVQEITKEKQDPERLKSIPGIMFLSDGRLFINPEYPLLSRNQLEALDFSHYCYYGSDMVSVFTERGCPYGCTFCSRVLGKRLRFLSIDRIIAILKEIAENSNITRVMFANDNMIYNLRRANKLFGRIIEEGLNERFRFLINGRIDNFISDDKKYTPHRINLDLADLLKKAGVEKISFGTESFNDAEIVRLKPEARYSGIDAMRLTRKLGERGITFVHFIIWPSPDAYPEEAIESTCRRFVVMESYRKYIEISPVFVNPVKISLVRGSGLYNRALKKDFQVKDLSKPDGGIIDIQIVEDIENLSLQKTDEDVLIPFATPVNRFGTTADPFMNLRLLEEELEALQNNENRSDDEEQRFSKLSGGIKSYRKQVNRINIIIRKINEETRAGIKALISEIGGIGRFLQEYAGLPVQEKRERLVMFSEFFDQASLDGPIDVLEADTRQIFYMYLVEAIKELVANPKKAKQIIRKHKRFTENIVTTKMMNQRENTPLHIFMNSLENGLALDKPSVKILKKHLKRYESHPW